jgi:hypothetical protein
MAGWVAICWSSQVRPRQPSGNGYWSLSLSNQASSPGVGSIGTTSVQLSGWC